MPSPFDFLLSIAAMPQSNGQASDELLREAYPELDFFFDEVADLRDVIDISDAEAEELERDLKLDVQRCLMVMEMCVNLIRASKITPLTKTLLATLIKEIASHED